MLDIKPPGAGFDVTEVIGVEPTDCAVHSDTLCDALARHAVVCLRMRGPLEDEELQQVAGLFGQIKDPVGPTKDGGEIRYSDRRQIIDAGFVIPEELRAAMGELSFGGLDDRRPGLFETFHTDDTYTQSPSIATVLHARELPPGGGGPTWFMDMRAAWEMLDARMKSRIAGLRVVYAYNNEGAFPPRRPARGPCEALVDVSHPLVRTHPRTGGRSLYLDLDRAMRIEGMPIDEGRALLRDLQDHAENMAPVCQHDWRDHDVLVWDNASLQHKAGGNFALGEPRRFWRYMVAGGSPV